MNGAEDERMKSYGFAKLEGDINYFIRKYEITMGRRSKNSTIDVILGDNMNISRKHAVIYYNFQRHCFELRAEGKNGVTIKGQSITPDTAPVALSSGDDVHIGDYKFKFLLAKDPAKQFGAGRASGQGAMSMGPPDAAAGARVPTQTD